MLTSSQQTAYVKNKFIGESGRLISDIIEISGSFNITGFLVTMYIEETFDSYDHSFRLEKVLFQKKLYYLDRSFIKRSTIVCHKWGTTIQYFKLEYLFIMALEILFLFIKKNLETKGIEIFEHCFLYTAYADDLTFFSERCTIY